MEIVQNLSEFSSTKPSFITIGTFDGVHIGHQQIIKRLVDEAAKNQCNSVLLTFFPHPKLFRYFSDVFCSQPQLGRPY